MSMDWLPRRRTDQLAMAKNWVTLITENTAAWGISQYAAQGLEGLADKAKEALSVSMSAERNAVTNQQMRTAFGEMTDFMRDLRRRNCSAVRMQGAILPG